MSIYDQGLPPPPLSISSRPEKANIPGLAKPYKVTNLTLRSSIYDSIVELINKPDKARHEILIPDGTNYIRINTIGELMLSFIGDALPVYADYTIDDQVLQASPSNDDNQPIWSLIVESGELYDVSGINQISLYAMDGEVDISIIFYA